MQTNLNVLILMSIYVLLTKENVFSVWGDIFLHGDISINFFFGILTIYLTKENIEINKNDLLIWYARY